MGRGGFDSLREMEKNQSRHRGERYWWTHRRREATEELRQEAKKPKGEEPASSVNVHGVYGHKAVKVNFRKLLPTMAMGKL